MKVGIIAKHTIAHQQQDFIRNLIKRLQQDLQTITVDENITSSLTKEIAKEKRVSGKTREQILKESDLVMVLGGDGTMLKVAGCLPEKNVLILGVNFGNKGFLTSIIPDDMEMAWKKILKKQYFINKRMLLHVQLFRHKKKQSSFVAMNEAVINQGSFARLIELTMSEGNQKMISFKADGMIIATPTGSTAHSLSAGGPIVHQELSAFIVTPICPASLSLRPIVIPSTNELTITIATERQKNQTIGLTIDGQVTVSLEYEDQVKISRSKQTMNLITFDTEDYYQLLREKIGWGKK